MRLNCSRGFYFSAKIRCGTRKRRLVVGSAKSNKGGLTVSTNERGKQMLHRYAVPIILLFISNIFMTYAWYGHLKHLGTKPLFIAIIVSWGIALFEYCFQVPANRLGHEVYTLPQLKIIQEVITMTIFASFTAVLTARCKPLGSRW